MYMPGARPKKPTSIQLANPEGINFIPFIFDYRTEDQILTLTKLEYYKNDIYSQVFNKIANLIFQKPYTIEILDLDEKNDEKLAKKFRQMADNPDVNLWKQFKNTWFSWAFSGAFIGSAGIDYLEDNSIGITEIRDLPPASFSSSGTSATAILAKGEFLEGIVRLEDNKVHYFQEQPVGSIIELKNCFHIKSPVYSYDIAGEPLIKILAKTLNRLAFVWDGVIQANNRAAAPSMFLRINTRDQTRISKNWLIEDLAQAKNILQTYSKNTLFPIPENFEPIEISSQVSGVGLETVDTLTKLFISAFSPTDFISRGDGALIGGSTNQEADLYKTFISGFQDAICTGWTPLFQKILEYNGYKGYTFVLKIPPLEFDDETLNLERAKELRAAGNCGYNEHRILCGLEPASKELVAEYKAEWDEIKPAPIIKENPLSANPMQDETTSGEGQMTPDEIKQDEKLKKNQGSIPTFDESVTKLETALGNHWTDLIDAIETDEERETNDSYID